MVATLVWAFTLSEDLRARTNTANPVQATMTYLQLWRKFEVPSSPAVTEVGRGRKE